MTVTYSLFTLLLNVFHAKEYQSLSYIPSQFILLTALPFFQIFLFSNAILQSCGCLLQNQGKDRCQKSLGLILHIIFILSYILPHRHFSAILL